MEKRVLWAETAMVICEEVWRALVWRRWADKNRSGFITTRFLPFHLFSKHIHVLVLLWDIVSECEGNWCPDTRPDKNRLQSVWPFLIDIISVSFSNCPRRCCFSPAHAAQASMARFLFSWHLISLQESTAHNLPSQPFASARASIAAPASTQACLQRENSMIKRSCPVSKSSLHTWRVATLMIATDLLLNDSVSSYLICPSGFFPGVLSASLRQHHYFSQQEGPAQRNIAMPYKRKRSISFSQ